MDGQRFDDLLRSLANSRRSLLGGTLAALAVRLSLTSAEARKKKRNKKKRCTAQNCAHGCCKSPNGPCGSGVVDSECGSGGKPCQVCQGTTSCREPELGACCQLPGGSCAGTRCCYERSGNVACIEGKCCIIHDGLGCTSSTECCEPTPFCLNGKCSAGCFGEEEMCGDTCCTGGKRCYGTVCCDPEFGCAAANNGAGSCCAHRNCCAPQQVGCLCEFHGCCG